MRNQTRLQTSKMDSLWLAVEVKRLDKILKPSFIYECSSNEHFADLLEKTGLSTCDEIKVSFIE